MKKKFVIFLMIMMFFVVDTTIAFVKKDDNLEIVKDNEMRIVYISYLEYLNNFCGNSKSINENKIKEMINNIKMLNFNTIMLHVSPFSDAIYNSKILPYSYTLTGVEGKNPGFDFLEYFLKIAHQYNIKVHAWINPYRIRMDSDTSKISVNNPAYKLLDTSNILVNKQGIYYNPASSIVKDLIISIVKEIVENYDVDGIHFDDYFYMQNDIDQKEYENYLNNGGSLSLKDFRLSNTNDLIRKVYNSIKKINNEIIFSISPDGNINNNYLYHYADIKTWLSEDGYVDIIMPQIYYGFLNQYKPFSKTLEEWQMLIINKNIKLIPILAFYKTGNVDEQAGSGKMEWVNNANIISNQVNEITDKELNGFGLFRYDFIFNSQVMNNVSNKELNNLKKILNREYTN